MSSFAELYKEVVELCSLETISEQLNRRLGEICTLDDVYTLIRKLESLNDADLVDDSGDIRDFYWRLRSSISDALVAAGEKAEGPSLSTLSSSNEKAAQFAARTLGCLKSKQATEPIINRMQARRNSDKLAYIGALGDIGDSRIIEVLVPYLTRSGEINGSWLVYQSAVALGKTGNESVLNPLASVLREDSLWLAKIGAAEGLGLLGNMRALPALQQAIADADRRVAQAAQESINRILSRGSGDYGNGRRRASPAMTENDERLSSDARVPRRGQPILTGAYVAAAVCFGGSFIIAMIDLFTQEGPLSSIDDFDPRVPVLVMLGIFVIQGFGWFAVGACWQRVRNRWELMIGSVMAIICGVGPIIAVTIAIGTGAHPQASLTNVLIPNDVIWPIALLLMFGLCCFTLGAKWGRLARPAGGSLDCAGGRG
jgi:HEAT repeat protein